MLIYFDTLISAIVLLLALDRHQLVLTEVPLPRRMLVTCLSC